MIEEFRIPIVISGLGGSGKTTVAKIVSEKLNLEFRSGGNYIRELAKELEIDEKAVDNGEFQKYRLTHPEIDFKLDKMQFDSLKKGGIVLESRFGALYHPWKDVGRYKNFHKKIGVDPKDVMHPNSVLSFFLECTDAERFSRLAKRREISISEVSIQEKARHEADKDLYKRIYNINPFDPEHSKIWVDVTKSSAEENAQRIINRYNQELTKFTR